MLQISASLMCADVLHLQDVLDELAACSVDYLHCDVMDGHFVPNMMMYPDMINRIAQYSPMKLDIHLMCEHPETVIDQFRVRKDDFITVHAESTPHLHRAVARINALGARAAVAINPGTSVEAIREVLDEIDMVLVMTVDPGFAGQKLVPSGLAKISRMKEYLTRLGYDKLIETDGNCSFTNIPKMQKAGADIVVVGSSSVFDPSLGIREAVEKLRTLDVQ